MSPKHTLTVAIEDATSPAVRRQVEALARECLGDIRGKTEIDVYAWLHLRAERLDERGEKAAADVLLRAGRRILSGAYRDDLDEHQPKEAP